jgi:hypothetical protein
VTGLACSLAHGQNQVEDRTLAECRERTKVLPPIRLYDSLTLITLSGKRIRGVYLRVRIGDCVTQTEGGGGQRIWDMGAGFIAGQPLPGWWNCNITRNIVIYFHLYVS